MMARRPRKVSTATWEGLPVDSRAAMTVGPALNGYVEQLVDGSARRVPGVLERVEALLLPIELGAAKWMALRALLEAYGRELFLAGAEREATFRTAAAAEHAMRLRLEAVLREHGIPVPTDRAPSEPPPE